MKWLLIVVLICISMMTDNVKYIFTHCWLHPLAFNPLIRAVLGWLNFIVQLQPFQCLGTVTWVSELFSPGSTCPRLSLTHLSQGISLSFYYPCSFSLKRLHSRHSPTFWILRIHISFCLTPGRTKDWSWMQSCRPSQRVAYFFALQRKYYSASLPHTYLNRNIEYMCAEWQRFFSQPPEPSPRSICTLPCKIQS